MPQLLKSWLNFIQMDFFGDDDEEEGGSKELIQLTTEERRSKYRWEISQEILKFILTHRDHQIQSEILIISADRSLCEQVLHSPPTTPHAFRWKI